MPLTLRELAGTAADAPSLVSGMNTWFARRVVTEVERPGAEPAEHAPSEAETLTLRLRAALDSIGEGIVICDAAGETVFRNAAADGMVAVRPSDALVLQSVQEVLGEALSGARPDRRLDLISPTRRTLSIRGVPMEGLGGAVAVVEDISERLRLEAVRRDFVANVSHELKTPVGALTLLAETLDGESDPQVVARLARRMGGEAERLGRIIDDLLDLSRIETNETPTATRVPLTDIVSEAVQSLRSVAAGLEVTLEVAPVSDDIVVAGDRRDLVSAVTNLVDNAIKYSEAGGRVQVRVERTPAGAAVSVADEGVGIPSRDLERIFERFYRVDRARSRATGGTGLGLSIVRHVAANHGGSVTVESVEGQGSTFTLVLPATGARNGDD